MGKMGYGYGSEWHLLRHLGYHRIYFSQKVANTVGGHNVEWLDFSFSPESAPLRDDREFVGLEFITYVPAQEKWKLFWPQTGSAQNWDAVGKICFGDTAEWLLVEAKGHLGEVKSRCGAKSPRSKQIIHTALKKASSEFGNNSQPVENWLAPYYQYANRLAVLYFLMKECKPDIPAHLLFIYFYGENRDGLGCPQNKEGWLPTIDRMNDWLGVDPSSALMKRVHHIFLPVNPASTGRRKMSNAANHAFTRPAFDGK
ncbi:MAG: hypothetical protein ACE5E7_17895 [Anaerolineae bacterium]